MANITIFAQVKGQLPEENIRKIIREVGINTHCKGYGTQSQLISMMFCQLSGCDSVRDISNGLKSGTGNLNHLDINRITPQSKVAYQNGNRDSSVFCDTFGRAFNNYKNNMIYFTELVLVLNHKMWYFFEKKQMAFAQLYNELYEKANNWAVRNSKGKDREYFYRTVE